MLRLAGAESRPVSAATIGYTLAPRLNAAGRMDRASCAAELLMDRITGGQRAVGLPTSGAVLEFVPDLPNWGQLPLTYTHLKQRLAVPPWTHTDGEIPPPRASSSSPPADLIGAVEALR